MSWVVISLVMGITIIINYEVLMRYVFSSPTQFSNEISRIMQVALAMLGGGYVLRKEGHVKVEIVFEHVRPKCQLLLGLVYSLLGCVYCSFLAWLTWGLVKSSFSLGERSFDLGLLLWPVKSIFFFGICMLGLQFLADSFKYYTLHTRKD